MFEKNFVLSLQTMNSGNVVSDVATASISFSMWSINCSTLSIMWCDNGRPIDYKVAEPIHP